MTKRLLSLLLALLLACGASPALAAAIGGGVAIMSGVSMMDSDEAVVSVTAAGDTLYLLYQSGVLGSRPVDRNEAVSLGEVMLTQYQTEEPEGGVGMPRFDRLFTWNGQPYGLFTGAGEVWALLDGDGHYAPAKVEGLALDTSALAEQDEANGYTNMAEVNSFFCEGDWLYYTGMFYNETPTTIAGRISLTTGKSQPFACANLSALAPVGDGTLVALLYDKTAMYSPTVTADLSTPAQYALFDPEKDEAAAPADIPTDNAMGGYSTGGICVGNGTLYYMDGSRIMGLDMASGETRLSAYTGEGMFGSPGGQALYANGYYVYAGGYDGLRVYRLDAEGIENGALTIFGEFGSETHKKFLRDHPEIPVDVSGDYTNSIEQLTQAMVSETQTYDVLKLYMSSMPVERLIQKGYCADLSQNQEIMDKVAAMYPAVVEPLMADGKLYGVPVEMTGTCYGVNMELWEELGLAEEDLPTSLSELYDFAANWVWDYGEDHPEITLFDYGQSDQILYSLLINDYIAYMQKQGGELKFDTPVFRKLLESFSAIDFEEISSVQDEEGNFWSSESLFSTTMMVGYLGMQSENYQPLYLAVEDGGEPMVAMTMSVLIINPRTKRMDQALAYVNSYLDNLDKTSGNITLFPDHNEPVENEYYQKNLKEMQDELADLQKRLETASVENRAEIEQEIEWQEESIASWEQYRYTVSAEDIAAYRDTVAPMVYVLRQSVFLNADTSAVSEINKMLMQYMEGAMDMDALVRGLDQRVRLMQLEDQ